MARGSGSGQAAGGAPTHRERLASLITDAQRDALLVAFAPHHPLRAGLLPARTAGGAPDLVAVVDVPGARPVLISPSGRIGPVDGLNPRLRPIDRRELSRR